MVGMRLLVSLLAVSVCLLTGHPLEAEDAEPGHYLNSFLVDVHKDSLEELISDHGFELADDSHQLEHLGLYHLRHREVAKRSKRSSEHHVNKLKSDSRVRLVEQQQVLDIRKRETIYDKQIELPVREFKDNSQFYRVPTSDMYKRGFSTPNDNPYYISYDDTYYPDCWFLNNVGQTGGTPGVDLHVEKGWKFGYYGQGINVLVLDDGLDSSHPDLKDNFNKEISADFNSGDPNDNDPTPDTSKPGNSHGTRCAGEIAGKADNGNCGVGVAHRAGIGGIRILDGPVTDQLEAKALNHKMDLVHIYSASWGPKDDGMTMDAPKTATRRALEYGLTHGRGGLGSLFVWATGNGGGNGDCCNADGYVSHPGTISIGSINSKGHRPYFMELCSSTIAVVPSGGEEHPSDSYMVNGKPKIKVVTTDVNGGCVLNFEGTSSAAPLAAGVLALVLDANPNLTWRDVQHLIAATARLPATARGKWFKNAGGFHVSYEMGFGVLDVGSMIHAAQYWTNVQEQHICDMENVIVNRKIPFSGCADHKISIDACQSDPRRAINWLEHVQLQIKLDHQRRGDISIFLIAPSSSKSQVLYNRPHDANSNIDFTFTTVHLWGEHPRGEWTVRVCDSSDSSNSQQGFWHHFSLKLYGMHVQRSARSVNRSPEDISVVRQRRMIAAEREEYRAPNIIKRDEFKRQTAQLKRKSKTSDLTTEELKEILDELDDSEDQLSTAKRGFVRGRMEQGSHADDGSQYQSMLQLVKKMLAKREERQKAFDMKRVQKREEYLNGYRWERILASSPNKEFADLLHELKDKVSN